MRPLILIGILILLGSCSSDEMSFLSIQNRTTLPIYVQPYISDFAEGDWIQPGSSNEFFSIDHDGLDGFEYFSFYYDSLVVYLKDCEEKPVKFYKDGRTVNYDPELNPFTNRDMWEIHQIRRNVSGNAFETLEEKKVQEHYFRISALSIPYIADTMQVN